MLFLLLALGLGGSAGAAPAKSCVCTCVVKAEDGSFSTVTGKGNDRETAGETLKKNLGKQKCELSPDCQGAACKADE